MIRNKIQKRGFTLIELLVVMSVIALMSSVTLVSFKKVKSKGRDAKRVADVRQILNALALEISTRGKVPCYGPNWDRSLKYNEKDRNKDFMEFLVTDKYIPDNPVDPLNDPDHHYSFITFKSIENGACGQIAYIDYTTENPITSCVAGGLLINNNHCHVFFPSLPNCPDWKDPALEDCETYIDTTQEYYSHP